MSRSSVTLPSVDGEFARLVESMCEGTIVPDERDRLESLLAGDRDAKLYYVAYMDLHAQMQWLTRGEGFGDLPQDAGAAVEPPRHLEDCAPPSSFILHPSSFSPHPLPLSHLSVGGPVFSYMVATVVLGMLLLGAWAYTITHDQHSNYVHKNSRGLTAPGGSTRQPPEFAFVGRVTGMKDCRWAESDTATNVGASVRLGRKYALSSGLVEIAYDSGAKVILEGPCTYEVESAAGGYLALGKLTALVECAKPQAVNHQISKSPNLQTPSSFIPHPSSFVVRTPTAVVTDLGTEFGVEVMESGVITTHVFQGAVRVQTIGGDRKEKGEECFDLHENDSLRIVNSKAGFGRTVVRGKADAAAFVRPGQLEEMARESLLKPFHRWQEHRDRLLQDPTLVAYYDFQQENGSLEVLRNFAAGGDRKLNGVVHDATWTDGRMYGKQALLFRGDSDYVQIDIPREMNDMTLAAWVKIDRLDRDSQGLLMSDGRSGKGHLFWHIFSDRRIAVGVISTEGEGPFDLYESQPLPESVPLVGKWVLLAVVYDGTAGRVTLYLDGRPIDEFSIKQRVPIRIGPARIANWDPADYQYHRFRDRALSCRMDELAVFARALSAGEIQRYFEAATNEKKELPMKQ